MADPAGTALSWAAASAGLPQPRDLLITGSYFTFRISMNLSLSRGLNDALRQGSREHVCEARLMPVVSLDSSHIAFFFADLIDTDFQECLAGGWRRG